MRLNYYSALVIILLPFYSCTNLNNINEKTKKIDVANEYMKTEVMCPNYYIPEETKYLLNKTKEKVIKIKGVKLSCKVLRTVKGEKNQKIIINQTIYYQILKNKLKVNKNNNFIYIALVDEKNKNIKSKVLSKIKIGSFKKVDGKIYFKNNKIFKINNNENNKSLTFYYGFQK